MAPLKRRKFGQLVTASLASTIVADLSRKAVAQSPEILYAVNSLNGVSTDMENQTQAIDLITCAPATGQVLSRRNVPAFSVDDTTPLPKKARAFFLSDRNRITKMDVLGNGILVISLVTTTKNGHFNKLIFINPNNSQFNAKKIRGFNSPDETIESFLFFPSKQILLCLVAIRGIPPFAFKAIDFTTGKIIPVDDLSLPSLEPSHRFANLCNGPMGNIFATEIDSEGIPYLISMNLQEKAIITGKVKIKRLAPLNIKGTYLQNDLRDLNYSSASNQLYALAAEKSRGADALHKVNVNTGAMMPAVTIAAEKFAFSR